MKARLRSFLLRVRSAALGPVLRRLDMMADDSSRQLADLHRRIDQIEALLQVIDGRAATATERSMAQSETEARLAVRVEEIEKLLSER